MSQSNIRSNSVAVSLQQNRLSGDIPKSLVGINNISVLSGNLFECDYIKSNLPYNDVDFSNYSCDSYSFDIPYYTW